MGAAAWGGEQVYFERGLRAIHAVALRTGALLKLVPNGRLLFVSVRRRCFYLSALRCLTITDESGLLFVIDFRSAINLRVRAKGSDRRRFPYTPVRLFIVLQKKKKNQFFPLTVGRGRPLYPSRHTAIMSQGLNTSPSLPDPGDKPITGSTPPGDSHADDILKTVAAMRSSHEKLLELNQQNSVEQSAQFDQLKLTFGNVSSQIADLKAENSSLRTELSALKDKVHLLETTSGTSSPHMPLINLIQELSERERCSSNVIAYGIPELHSRSSREKIANDKKFVFELFFNLSINVPTDVKLFRIGKNYNNDPRPLKIIFKSKTEAASLLSSLNETRRNYVYLPPGIRFVRDKSKLERQLLRESHEELERRMHNGEKDLSISYNNGIPQINSATSKPVPNSFPPQSI